MQSRDLHGFDALRRPSRGSAVNVNPRHTFEVRAFRSTLDPVHAQAALGFVDASVRYAADISAHDVVRKGAWRWDAFASYVRNHDNDYSSLATMI
jgi:hypothetical protein